MELQHLLEKSSHEHSHLCPRQILGVRMGLAGMQALGFDVPPAHKQLLVITETDGCFADGISAATACTAGHRTLRVEDYGKTAAVFVDTFSGQTVRLAPTSDIRQKAYLASPNETRRYEAQLQAYQIMPDCDMFTITRVILNAPIEAIISHPGLRVNCACCGEEIINAREVWQNGLALCHTCAYGGYYRDVGPKPIAMYAVASHPTLQYGTD